MINIPQIFHLKHFQMPVLIFEMKFPPIFSEILKNRYISFFIIIVPVLVLFMIKLGVFTWQCPFYTVTELPCSSCGLTRAFEALIKGDIFSAIRLNLLSPLLFLIWLLFLIMFILPNNKIRKNLLEKIKHFEIKSGIFFILIALYLIYGIARIFISHIII